MLAAVGMLLALTAFNRSYAHKVGTAGRLADRVTDLENRFESVQGLARRINNRERMREAREHQDDDGPTEPARKYNGREPDWRKDPQGFIAHHEGRMKNGVLPK